MKKLFTLFIILCGLAGIKNSNAQIISACADLYISEYIEGSSNNKAIELYNPTSNAIAMSDYKLVFYFNGQVTGTAHVLSGNIASGDVFVIAATTANAAILAQADQTISGASFYNGNDAVVLIKISTVDTLDKIGIIGNDPGTNAGWPVDTGSTYNHTLVRIPGVHNGNLNWATCSQEWIADSMNNVSYLGSHNQSLCTISIDPVLNFSVDSQNINEAGDSVMVTVNIFNSNNSPTSVFVVDGGTGTASFGSDYSFPGAQQVTFPANSSTPQSFWIPIINDANVEGNETIILSLIGATNNASIGIDSVQTITIIDDDGATNPTVTFTNATQTVNEGGGSVNVAIAITNANATATSVNVQFVLAGSTATPGGTDFTFNNTTVTFPAGSSVNQNLTIPINDDTVFEGNEIFILRLLNPTNGATIGIALDTVTIVENDPNAVDNFNWQNTIDVYPNPVLQTLFLGQPVKYSSVEIVNLLGQVVKTILLTNDDVLKINVSDLNSGIYFIRIYAGKEIVEKKFVKQ